MLLDHCIMGFAAGVFMMPSIASTIISGFSNGDVSLEQKGFLFYLSYVGFALYLCKDSIDGRSPAKRVLKLQVVDNKSGETASALRCLIRNFLCFLWPLEVVAVLINPERKIGDYVAGTRLTFYDGARSKPEVNIWQIVVALIIAYIFIFMLMFPFV